MYVRCVSVCCVGTTGGADDSDSDSNGDGIDSVPKRPGLHSESLR